MIRRAPTPGSRSLSRERRRAHSLHVRDLASLSQASQVGRGAVALAVPQGHLVGRLRRSARGPVGSRSDRLSSTTISRLKAAWADDYERWTRRDLSAKRYVDFWADGVYFQPRLDHAKQCLLVIIGADEISNKDVVGLSDGYRESEQSWLELLLDLKRRGLAVPPELTIGDGALGFSKALRQAFGQTREQRCWVHKTANVLNKLRNIISLELSRVPRRVAVPTGCSQ